MNRILKEDYQKFAIVVPCYHVENRFPHHHFLTFAKLNPDVLLCFVNDGSKDNTSGVLKGIQMQSPDNIVVLNLKENGGKSAAVRHGMLYVHSKYSMNLLGFLDADMATTPEEWLKMALYKESYPKFGAIVGSRIQRIRAEISSNEKDSLWKSILRLVVKGILKTNFQDTQCGAKIFQRSLVPFLFAEPFQTSGLFDVEIFLRLQQKFGKTSLQKGVLEFPLMQWAEKGETRMKLIDSFKIPFQLFQLYYTYRFTPMFYHKSETMPLIPNNKRN
ncbi:glycosyltransferase [Echinicola shivajiensis]|uniref:glycosyltransferase n=1 Tax=Echinicola shivajiensis TaxID=1035916 RepID=UPI001BFCD39F|nr:glycosyltransferase [Echinicola shivajiensis]